MPRTSLLCLFVGISLLVTPSLRASDAETAPPSASDLAEKALTTAARDAGVRSADGARDAVATTLARAYAEHLAAIGYLDGHAGFAGRSAELGGNASEVIAENWGGSVEGAATQCIRSWLGSPPHYAIMVPYHRRYAYAMAQGSTGAYFCVGLFAD